MKTDTKPPQNNDELVATLKTALGLKADATPAEVVTGLTAKLTTPETKPSTEEKKGEVSEEIKALTATVGELAGQVKILSANVTGNERAAILAQAARDGKEVPKTAAEKMGVEDLKILCAELPVTVPMDKRSPEHHTLMLRTGGGVDLKDDEVSKHTGVSVEDRKKYGDA